MTYAERLKLALQQTCPDLEDFSYTEIKEIEAELGKSSKMDYVGCQVDGDTVKKIYACHICNTTHVIEEAVVDDFIYIGDAPSDEYDCYKQYTTSTICQALIIQLRNTFGKEPDGAHLARKFEGGADGYTVVCHYNTGKPESEAYAYMLEGNLPERWSGAALTYLESTKKGGDN